MSAVSVKVIEKDTISMQPLCKQLQAHPVLLQSATAVHKLCTNPGVLPLAASSLQRSGDENAFLCNGGAREGLGNEKTGIETGEVSLGQGV